MSSQPSSSGSARGWVVALSGTGINLALGVLYTWSVISKSIPKEWNWSEAGRAWPYTIACLVFAFMMVPAGKLQDKFGPRIVASIGGVLTGLGLILTSGFTNVTMFIVGFGILAGSGFGFGYASATPPAVKWFPPAKTGMIAGIVVAGFGLASVYISPLATFLIRRFGVQSTMLILGIAFLVVVVALSQLLVNPSATHQAATAKAGGAPATRDFTGSEMLKTRRFYILWIMYAFNAGAGLMIIGKLAKLVEVQTASQAGFVLVALLAIGNAGGRLLAGTLSDKLGRIRVLRFFTAFQAVLMFVTPSMSNLYVLVVFSMCIGMNYGSNLSLFPTITKESFGIKNLGVNYGLVFTAWGVGSLMALIAGRIYDSYGKFDYALYIAGCLLIVTLLLSMLYNYLEVKRINSRAVVQEAAA
jgi:OFA family oxalate/formate antiporter-like MFS transporter